MKDFETLTEVRAVSPLLIYDATEWVQQSGFSFWDTLTIETALDAGASRLVHRNHAARSKLRIRDDRESVFRKHLSARTWVDVKL